MRAGRSIDRRWIFVFLLWVVFSVSVTFPARAAGASTALGAGSLSPTFSWLKGGTTVVRVEFSASPTFAKPRVRNIRTYKPITTWVPNATKWAAIQRLAPPGAPIYWHVVGKNGSSTSKFPSGDVFSFTVGP